MNIEGRWGVMHSNSQFLDRTQDGFVVDKYLSKLNPHFLYTHPGISLHLSAQGIPEDASSYLSCVGGSVQLDKCHRLECKAFLCFQCKRYISPPPSSIQELFSAFFPLIALLLCGIT
jgi:hypothetical protein